MEENVQKVGTVSSATVQKPVSLVQHAEEVSSKYLTTITTGPGFLQEFVRLSLKTC